MATTTDPRQRALRNIAWTVGILLISGLFLELVLDREATFGLVVTGTVLVVAELVRMALALRGRQHPS